MPLRCSRVFREGINNFYMRFLGGIHDFDDFAEGGGFIGFDGKIQIRLLANLREQFGF